jgi:5-methylcytosine-specific restriction enzyme A
MPSKPPRPCAQPGCSELVRGRDSTCEEHARQRASQRENRGGSSYGRRWSATIQPQFLYHNPWCALCGREAKVADHYPKSRKDLIKEGVDMPDAFRRMRPLCMACDAKERPKREPGGFHAENVSKAQSPSHAEWQRWTAKREVEQDIPPY